MASLQCLCCCSTYEGDVVNGVRHGVGVLHAVSLGITYSGDWVMGKQHGKVTVFHVLSIRIMLHSHHTSVL